MPWGACLFEVASLWNALKESLVPVRKAELKGIWKFLMVFLQHSGARSAYLPGIAWHTPRQAQSGSPEEYLQCSCLPFGCVCLHVGCGNGGIIFPSINSVTLMGWWRSKPFPETKVQTLRRRVVVYSHCSWSKKVKQDFSLLYTSQLAA